MVDLRKGMQPMIGPTPGAQFKNVVALCGGIGGAKLALGLQHLLGERLAVIVNIGDDFDHLTLRICPDLDTVLYTLSGLADPVRGWGRGDESWHCMDAMKQLGGDTWFSLGDRDLALHLERTRRLAGGESLTSIMSDIAARLGIRARILPASDDRVRTKVETPDGVLEFQRYFVEQRCAPRVVRILFDGAERARLTNQAAAALRDAEAVVICPSNPYLSVDPILAIGGVRDALAQSRAPVVAVSPIIGGQAVKGPTAKIMHELKHETTSASIAAHYAGLLGGLVIDASDAGGAKGLDVPVHCAATLMTDLASRVDLAREVLAFAARLRTG